MRGHQTRGVRSHFKPAALFVGQRDNNAVTRAANELQHILIVAGDFVYVMLRRGNYMDRVGVSSPIYCKTFSVQLSSKHTLGNFFVSSIRTHHIAHSTSRRSPELFMIFFTHLTKIRDYYFTDLTQGAR
jgi:hypothetical protein